MSRQHRRPEQAPKKADEGLDQKKGDEVGEIGPDVGPEQAPAVGNQTGNDALQGMLRDAGRIAAPAVEAAVVEVAAPAVELGAEAEAGLDDDFAELLSAMGKGPREFAPADHEDWARLVGGAPGEPPPKPQKRWKPARPDSSEAVVGMAEDLPPLVHEADLVELELPAMGRPGPAEGDERFDALWPWLQVPLESVGPGVEAEDLVDRPGPLQRAERLGRFLAASASRPSARFLGRAAGPLPGLPSLASQVARAAALAELAGVEEAEAAGMGAASRACALALEDEAAPAARRVARALAEKGRFTGVRVFETALRQPGEPEEPRPALPRPPRRAGQGLMLAALLRVASPSPLPPLGGRVRLPSVEEWDEDSAAVDRLLRELTGAPEETSELDFTVIQPMLDAGDALVLAAGRAQVELASAALAVHRVAGSGARERLMALLRAADADLRGLARAASEATRALEAAAAAGDGDAVDEQDRRLAEVHGRLDRLRASALEGVALLAEGPGPLGTPPPGQPEALAAASRRAAAAGEWKIELELRLRLVLALAESNSRADAEALLPRAERESAEIPSLALLRALARGACGREGALQELAALDLSMAEPALAQKARVMLAEALLGEGRWERIELEDPLCLGVALLRAGRLEAAEAALARVELEGPGGLGAGLLRSGLLHALGRPDLGLARGLAHMARHRRAWSAWACAAMDLAACPGPDPDRVLFAALQVQRAEGEPAALLQAAMQERRLAAQRTETPEEG